MRNVQTGVGSCALCPIGEYQSATGATACVACVDENSTTEREGGAAISACVSVRGYYPSDSNAGLMLKCAHAEVVFSFEGACWC